MKKNKLLPIILASVNLVICLLLIIFLTPAKVPLIVDFHEKVAVIGSKWWLLIGACLPIAFMVVAISTKGKYLKLVFTELIILVFYINMLGFSYFCAGEGFAIGEQSEVPISLVVFLPIALWLFIYGSIIKNLPYKHGFGVRSKNTQTTEFIWKQTHISASYHFRLWGFILIIVSSVFAFVRYPLIEICLFVVGLIVPRVVIEVNAIKMTKKYNEMAEKQERLSKKK